ncbi:InlB B-repeat-containing protein [Parabacteroides acidifaciens]|uniref:InlB B-repeat-containing protein n=1 Tax=Parabacteroides acidifaciens TaxID=2290935 RepID=A0A3D8HHX9_9BACT|nr:InlB B-repeat-containing protein [Parabacteroides acidifaciens]MBC8600804.1 InlB B-repeat-containing protein [Parabacteroides acidifaciens]RDU50531.1 hypothetical protein DWU89_03655 [Parabacteroides acidifaciens]
MVVNSKFSFFKNTISIAALMLLLIMSQVVYAQDVTVVTDVTQLRSAVKDGKSYIKLASPDGNIELGENPLEIKDGTIILDLNGQTLSAINAANMNEAICIKVNGANANLKLKDNGNGGIYVKGRKADDKGKYSISSGDNGANASAIVLTEGSILIKGVTLNIEPGAGGKKGGSAFLGSDGKQGNATFIRSENGVKYKDIIAEGCILKQGTNIITNLDVTELKFEATSSIYYVEQVTYKLTYDTKGGENPSRILESYTIDDNDLDLPIPGKSGYNFDGWYKDDEKLSSVAPFPRATENPYLMNLIAHWDPIKYKITYHLDEGENPNDAIDVYTIESAVTLKEASKDGYRFMGWYDNANFSGNKVTTISEGSAGDKSFYAKWSQIYNLTYHANGGIMPDSYSLTYIKEDTNTPFLLPVPTPQNENYTFMGWCEKADCSDAPILELPEGSIADKVLYAKWNETYHITYHWLVPADKPTMKEMVDKTISYTKDDEVILSDSINGAYKVGGWYDNPDLTGEAKSFVIPKGTKENFHFYAKWIPVVYTIKYETYYGSFPAGITVPTEYTYESGDINLPYPVRGGYTFSGWFTDAALTKEAVSLAKGSMGNKTFYAKWTLGNVVSISQPANGKIKVTSGNLEIKNNEKVGAGIALKVTATPDSSIYSLVKLRIGDKTYTSSPVDTIMPGSDGLTISAEFADNRPAVSAPKIVTNPVSTDFIAAGESVTVTLENTDNTSTLYYSLDGSTPKLYSKPFQVSSLTTGKTIQIVAYAKKEGYKDGIATRDIVFAAGKITITFDLPKGITAVNPEGGEVVSAIATGGSFEFKLVIDKNYFESLDSLVVSVGGKNITPDSQGVYTLTGNTSNVVVKVTGITGIKHKVVLSQTANGYIYFTSDENAGSSQIVNYGDRISITARPDEGYKFFTWSDGITDNPRIVTVEKDTTIQARFVQEDPGYLVVLPTLTGVKVKPLTGYPTEVKKGGTFKFYISKDADYSESEPEVYANGEKLTVYKDVYSVYNITKNIVIAVNGIKLNEMKLDLPENVSGIHLETGKDVKDGGLTPVSMIAIRAMAPSGKTFSMWNDGKADNPRIIAAKDAGQLLPLFVEASDEPVVKVELPVLMGAGVGTVNANSDAVALGGDIQLKLVVLPQYSNSQIKVTANGDVLDTDLSLRASSETKTLFYNLKKVTKDVKIDVSGLEINNYKFSLQQTVGGTIRADKTGSLKHGTVVTLTASPVNGSIFLKWSDGNTLNPYAYTLTGDCVMSAQYGNADIPLANADIQLGDIRIYAIDNMLHVETEQPARLSVWNLGGLQIKSETLPGGHSAYQMSAGTYVVKVGEQDAVKVFIR